jgi:hypothetical protein
MMNVEQSVEWELAGEKLNTWRKPVPVPLCPSRIPHDLTRARTRAAAVGNRRLTACAMGFVVVKVAGFLRVFRFPLPIFIPPNSPSSQSPGAGTIGQKWSTCRVDPV